MFRKIVIKFCLLLLGPSILALWISACWQDDALLFHAGVGQRSSLLDIEEVFAKRNPELRVNYCFKGSGYFIADIERSHKGDLYLPGEEFYMLQALERGHILDYDPKNDIAAHFMVVIATPRGNPKKIKSLKDFAREDVKIGLGNPKACAIGIWDQKTFERAGIWKEVQRNSIQSAKCIAEKLTAVQNKVVDATLIWSSTAVLALRDIEIIPIEPRCRGFVRLPVAVVKYSKRVELAKKLKDFILSKEGAEIFESHAYVCNPGPLDERGFCLDGGEASDDDCRYLVNAAKAVKDSSLPLTKEFLGPLIGEVQRQRKTLHAGDL